MLICVLLEVVNAPDAICQTAAKFMHFHTVASRTCNWHLTISSAGN